MSRKEVMSDSRCPICGGKMRLVNVTHTNTFCAPEASQYDRSISDYKNFRKKASDISVQELMCTNCCRRSSVSEAKANNGNAVKKNRVGQIIVWVVLILVLAISAYLVYKHRGAFGIAWQRLGELFGKAKGFIAGLFNK